MKTLKINGSWTQFVEPLRNLEAFKTGGSLYGEPGSSIYVHPGHLPEEYRASLKCENVIYVVYSWATPIAWYCKIEGWVMPDHRYSVSTSKQQGRIRTALSELGL